MLVVCYSILILNEFCLLSANRLNRKLVLLQQCLNLNPLSKNSRSTTELQGLLPQGETCTKINGYMDLLIAYPPTLVQSSLKLYAHIQTAIFSIFMTLPTPNPLPM